MTYIAFNGLLNRIAKIQRQFSGQPPDNRERLAEKEAEISSEIEL